MTTIEVRATRARNAIWTTFFVMGILSMAWVPRIPEVKKTLGINNGQFGVVLLGGTIGAVFGAQIGGRVVHYSGSKSVLRVATLTMPAPKPPVPRRTLVHRLRYGYFPSWRLHIRS